MLMYPHSRFSFTEYSAIEKENTDNWVIDLSKVVDPEKPANFKFADSAVW